MERNEITYSFRSIKQIKGQVYYLASAEKVFSAEAYPERQRRDQRNILISRDPRDRLRLPRDTGFIHEGLE